MFLTYGKRFFVSHNCFCFSWMNARFHREMYFNCPKKNIIIFHAVSIWIDIDCVACLCKISFFIVNLIPQKANTILKTIFFKLNDANCAYHDAYIHNTCAASVMFKETCCSFTDCFEYIGKNYYSLMPFRRAKNHLRLYRN